MTELVQAASGAIASLGFDIDVTSNWRSALGPWERLARDDGAALPFQRETWLAAWYATMGRAPGVEPFAVTVRDSQTGQPVMALPLVRRREGSLRILSFADGGVTDYNAPILSVRAPQDERSASRLWRALWLALPPADLVRFEKMPASVGSLRNPLTLLKNCRGTPQMGLCLTIAGAYEDWRRGLDTHFRKELGRSGRVFDGFPGAAFRRLDADAEADRVFAELKRLQKERISELGLSYSLDAAAPTAFYRLLAGHLRDGSGILTALTVGDDVVAALFGIRSDSHYVMLRIAAAGGPYTRCSPGRLVIARTIEALHAEGLRTFDFALGDYAYKRRLGPQAVPLFELVAARSLRGLPQAALSEARHAIRSRPALAGVLRRLRHKDRPQ